MQIEKYADLNGAAPFDNWISRLRDRQAVNRILARLARLEAGLWGDCKSVGEGVLELRVDHGPGYRVYFARHGNALILLLTGGDKGKQKQDIEKAKEYWHDWKKRKSEDE